MLTDEQIDAIAKPFIRSCGDHFVYEDAIPEKDIENFARAIEKTIRAEMHGLLKRVSEAMRDPGGEWNFMDLLTDINAALEATK